MIYIQYMHLIQLNYYCNIIQYINNKYYLQLLIIYITSVGFLKFILPIITTYILFRIMK